MSKKVYISGPMQGIEDFNYPAFNQAERELKEAGFVVINPTRHPEGLEYEQYMQYAMLDVEICDIVMLLPNWTGSPGAKREAKKAYSLDKSVFTVDAFLREFGL